jgi:UDP-N-acetylmuramate dehydrogenase
MSLVIQSNIDLQPFNTFKVRANARYFTLIQSIDDVLSLLSHPLFKENKHLILGGGSNIVLLNDFDGLVIKSDEKQVRVVHESEDEISIEVSSGMAWHDLVTTCLTNNWGGVENLSLIPGTVGAAPIQNIGAYGVEIKNVVEKVSGVNLLTGAITTLSNSECKFSYRESIFKHALKEIFFISSVTLRLTKKNHHVNYSYDALKHQLDQSSITKPSIHDVSHAVIQVRKSKLPDPALIGNAGSFFKNPVITETEAERLKIAHPTIPIYQFENQLFKVAAGWLIEKSGWKGKRIGNVGVHDQQALVIVNHFNASGEEIFDLSERIIRDVKEKFEIELIREVNVIR